MSRPADPLNNKFKNSVRSVFAEAYRFFKATPYAVSVIWKFQPVLLLWLAISTVFNGISLPVSVWITRYLLDAVVNAYQQHGQVEYVRRAVYILLLQFFVSICFDCAAKATFFYRSVLAMKLSLDMQIDLNQSMSRLNMKDYDNPEIYDMISRAKGEAQNNKPLVIVSGVADITSNIITWLSFSIVLLKFSGLVVAIMLALCIPYLILNLYFSRANFSLQYGRTQEQRVAGYLTMCFNSRRSLPEIITFDLWSFLQKKWIAFASKFMQQDISLLKRRTVTEMVIIALTYLGRGGASLYIILKCLLHFSSYTIGQMMMFVQSFSGGVNALAQVMQQLSGIYEGSCFLQNYQQFLDVQKSLVPSTKPQIKVPEVIETVEFRDISFIYPGTTAYALQNINLTFRKGQSTLLVGRNGAGKTTLARLLVALYSPTKGQILINGHDIQEYDLTLLRKKMSIIFQDFVRYALTVEENIGLGSVEHMADQQRIVTAAKAARLDDIIARLPKGYATMLGKEFRDGQDLSLGEWQRICLARLFMRNASIMVYDEPSASLDVETESELLREISLSGTERICVLISHRMLRSDIADRIVVVEKGEILEQGNHDELVILGGRYAQLWKTYHRLGNNELDSDYDVIGCT